MKCEVCGMDIQKEPCISKDGKCQVCNQKLTLENQSK